MGSFISSALQFLLGSILAGIFTGLVVELIIRTPEILRRRKLRLLLDFPKQEELVFVYPPRHETLAAFLPRTSTEDFMAMNNMISALLSIGWNSERIVIRNTERVTQEQKEGNVVVFCSPKSNDFAREVQQALHKANIKHHDFIEGTFINTLPEWAITYEDGYFLSPANRRLQELGESIQGEENQDNQCPIDQESLQDFAVITKVRNPWNPQHQVLLIAGIRGIGTWGAAETMKKWYSLIYERKKGWPRGSRKNGSFSALLKIHYRNSDIVKAEVVSLIDIEQP